MFRVSQHPSSGVLRTVSATSGISHGTGTATSFHRGLIELDLLLTLNHDAQNHELKKRKGKPFSLPYSFKCPYITMSIRS